MPIGKTSSNITDQFVITRQVNHPELIFNQCQRTDHYFDIRASVKWSLSDKNTCFDCQKHKYTAICYDQSLDPEANKDLKQIKDPKLICKIRKWMNLGICDEDRTTPYVCGTIVNGGFTRKLRMLRIDFYSFLLLTNS